MEPINILYLHGANAHPDNFNYYKLLLPEHNSIAPTYNMDDNPFDVVDFVTRKVNREFGNKPIVVIGGINDQNYKKLLQAGAKYIAISSFIWDNPKFKPKFAIRKFK